jgi:fructokinase
MSKVIGIGETVFDILFKNGQPVKAVPGGSVYNSIISLGRVGAEAAFISEVGDDRIGEIILSHLRDSGVDASSVCCFSGGKSPLALAFLNERNDAEYLFYKDYPNNRLEVDFPKIEKGDIVLYGSYFVLNPVLREKTKAFLQYAKDCGAILYYDINFRKNHVAERIKLGEALIENLEFADIVRGSADDFNYLYEMTDAEKIYKEKIKFYCPEFIFTSGDGDVRLFTKGLSDVFPVKKVEVVSTVGAGDNFNAGVVYGLLMASADREALSQLSREEWSKIISCGLDFSAHACTLIENYVDKEWAANYRNEKF